MKNFCGYCGSAMKTAKQDEEVLEVDQKIFNAVRKGLPIMLLGDDDYDKNEREGILNVKRNMLTLTSNSYLSKLKKYMRMTPEKAVDYVDKRENTRKEENASTVIVLVKSDENGKIDKSLINRLVDSRNQVFKPEKSILTKDQGNPIKLALKGKPEEVEYCHVVSLSIRPEEK